MIESFINDYSEEIIRFVLILVIGIIVIKIILKILERSTLIQKIDTTIGKFVKGLIKFILYSVYIIILLSVLGVPMTTFVAMLSAIGLAIALALQGNLANFSSALVILTFKPFKVGDFIESGNNMGTVREIALLSTCILTPDNRRVIIPNSELVTLRVINYSAEENRRIDMVFTAAYDNDVNEVIQIISEIVKANEKILLDPEPIIRLINHGQNALEYDVKVWTKKEEFWNVKYQMNEDVRTAFNDHDIKIPYPQRELWLTQNNK